jgi:hypothetical protein
LSLIEFDEGNLEIDAVDDIRPSSHPFENLEFATLNIYLEHARSQYFFR